MNTAQDIIDDVNARLPNSYSNEQLVKWINMVMINNYKAVGYVEGYQFFTVEDQAIYSLPSDCEFKTIRTMTVDEKEHYPKNLEDAISEQRSFYEVTQDTIGIHPTPQKSGEYAYIWYIHKPSLITIADLTVTPEIKTDYIDLIKYGVMRIISEAYEDIAKHNNYAKMFNEILRTAKQEKWEHTSKYPKTQDVMPNKRGNRTSSQKVSETLSDILKS